MDPSFENSPALPPEAVLLITDISRLMDEAETLIGGSMGSPIAETADGARNRGGGAQRRLAARYAALKARLASAGRRTDEVVRTYPYESAAFALGVGLLLGACFWRRRD